MANERRTAESFSYVEYQGSQRKGAQSFVYTEYVDYARKIAESLLYVEYIIPPWRTIEEHVYVEYEDQSRKVSELFSLVEYENQDRRIAESLVYIEWEPLNRISQLFGYVELEGQIREIAEELSYVEYSDQARKSAELLLYVEYSGEGGVVSDHQPVYMEGASAGTGISDHYPVYLKGSATLSDHQPVYLFGGNLVTDHQPAYLTGRATIVDNQYAYIRGGSSLSDNQSAYLFGALGTTNNLPAYILALGGETSTQPVYIYGYPQVPGDGFIDIEITLEGEDITSKLLDYSREQNICTGTATLRVTTVALDENPIPYDELVLYEGGVKRGKFFVKSCSFDHTGKVIMESQDASIKLMDHFITEQESYPYETTARFWIEKYLNEAHVSYTINTSSYGAPIPPDSVFGFESAYDIIVTLLQQSNWYIYFNPNSRAIIGKLNVASGRPRAIIHDDKILNIGANTNDKMLRNRAVVWGGADIINGTWVFADVTVITRWNYDEHDKRAIVLSNNHIQTYSDAYILANQMLNEFNVLTYEKTVRIVGDINVSIGDYVMIHSDRFRAGGITTTINSEMSDAGFVTTLTLDQRCPRIFGFYGEFDDFVYIGTDGAGVWQKPLDGDGWVDYSTGLTELGIRDLSINQNVFGTVTTAGSLYHRTILSSWQSFMPVSGQLETTVSGIIMPSGIFDPSGLFATCVVVGKTINNIYGGFTTDSGILLSGYLISGGIMPTDTRSWVVKLGSNGAFMSSNLVHFPYRGEEIKDVAIVDIDNNGTENVLSVIAMGQLVYIKGPDDGYFGDIGMLGYSQSIFYNWTLGRLTLWPETQITTIASTDREMVASLPSVDTDFSTLPYTSDTLYGNHIGNAYNKEEDLGTWWGIDGHSYDNKVDIYKNEWGDQSWEYGRAIYQTVEMFDATELPEGESERIVAFYKKSDTEFVILCENYDQTNIIITYNMYEYDTTEESLTLVASDSREFYSFYTYLEDYHYPSHAFSGNVYVSETYATLKPSGEAFARPMFVCNLEDYTIYYEDWLYIGDYGSHIYGTTNDVSTLTVQPLPIVIYGDSIISAYVVWEKSVEQTIWSLLRGKFVSHTVNKHTGEVRTVDTLINNGSDEKCYDEQSGRQSLLCSSWGDIIQVYNPLGLGANTTEEVGYFIEWAWYSFTSDGIVYYVPYQEHEAIINRHEPPPFPPDTPTCCHDLSEKYRFKVLGIKVTSGGLAYGIYSIESLKEYFPDEVGPPDRDVPNNFPSNPDYIFGSTYGLYGGGSGHNRFTCGSFQRGEWWMIMGHPVRTYAEDRKIGYDIYDMRTGVPSYIGRITPDDMPYPDYHPDDSTWQISYVLPQTDDFDGTIYIEWVNGWGGNNWYQLMGHSPTGSITKRISDSGYNGTNLGYLMGNSIVTPGLSYNMITYPTASVTRFWEYDQPQATTTMNYILRQNEDDITVIYTYPLILTVDTSKNSPTVFYRESLMEQPYSDIWTSFTNGSGDVQHYQTLFPIYDVRTFDIGNPNNFFMESGDITLSGFRYIAMATSSGINFMEAFAPSGAAVLVTPSGLTGSGIAPSGILMPSGVRKIETTNYSASTPYFFASDTVTFYQRNPDLNFWYTYGSGLPGSPITIIRTDDRI